MNRVAFHSKFSILLWWDSYECVCVLSSIQLSIKVWLWYEGTLFKITRSNFSYCFASVMFSLKRLKFIITRNHPLWEPNFEIEFGREWDFRIVAIKVWLENCCVKCLGKIFMVCWWSMVTNVWWVQSTALGGQVIPLIVQLVYITIYTMVKNIING